MNTSKTSVLGRLRVDSTLATVPISSMLLAACAPITVTYYRLDEVSGKVVKAWCAPVYSFILINTHDVIVGFKVSPLQTDRLVVTVTFEMPEKHDIKLMDRFFEILGPPGVCSKSELTGNTWVAAGCTAEIPLDMPMLGSTKKGVFHQGTL
jgi:hypothetical protein